MVYRNSSLEKGVISVGCSNGSFMEDMRFERGFRRKVRGMMRLFRKKGDESIKENFFWREWVGRLELRVWYWGDSGGIKCIRLGFESRKVVVVDRLVLMLVFD